MPGRRYYCYYCDVTFPYSREARKRHNGGHVHARVAAQHYHQHQSAMERYNTETNREKCRKFLSGKGCDFGETCIYSHTTPQQLQELRLEAEHEALIEEYGPLPSQVTSSSPSAMNILALDSVAVTKMIVAQRRQRLLSLYPAQMNTATLQDNNTQQQQSPVTAIQSGNRGTVGAFGTVAATPNRLHNWSSPVDGKMNTSANPYPSVDAFPSKLVKVDSMRSLLINNEVSATLPPSMRPYSLDTMLSKPLPEWG